MRYITLPLFNVIFWATTSLAQTKTDCFPVKYLDFFGIENMDTIKWSSSTLDQLLTTDFIKEGSDKNSKTNFLIPVIMLQLKSYYPACSSSTDTSAFRKLKELYFKIREQDLSAINLKPVSAQLEIIRADFYSQAENDSLLAFMSYTTDDGPFYGEIPENIPDYKNGSSYKTAFGTVYITSSLAKVFLTVADTQGQYLWTRIMTGKAGRPLAGISFSGKDIIKTSLGYQFRMVSEGEALNLYLKSDGAFRYYFHSW